MDLLRTSLPPSQPSWSHHISIVVTLLTQTEDVDKNGDGCISRKEFYDNMYAVYGWQAWLAKGHIHKTFDRAVKQGDLNGDGIMSIEEVSCSLPCHS